MKKQYCDVFVSGGGLAGLMTSLALADKSRKVICCDLNWDFSTEITDFPQDQRVTALFNNSLEFLNTLLPLKTLLSTSGKRLSEIEVLEAGANGDIKQVSTFSSKSVSKSEFGWVIANRNLRSALLAEVRRSPYINLLPKVGVAKVFTRAREAHIILSNGGRIVAKLLVGADGKNSQVRNSLQINTRNISLPQAGISFNVRHKKPLGQKSIEIYQSGGPFTIIPLPGEDEYCSNIIWMNKTEKIDKYYNLEAKKLAIEAGKRSQGAVGEMELISSPMKWTGNYQMAKKLYHERAVLIAEAAHNLPPLGAQGLNLTVSDIKLLLEFITLAEDPGDIQILTNFASKRFFPVLLKFIGTNFLNLLSFSNLVPLRTLRSKGASLFSSNNEFQRLLIQFGLNEELF